MVKSNMSEEQKMEDDGIQETGKANAKIKVIRLEECFAYLGTVPLEQIYEEASQNNFNVSEII